MTATPNATLSYANPTVCDFCKQPLGEPFYRVKGRSTCASCAAQVVGLMERNRFAAGPWFLGALAGFIAAERRPASCDDWWAHHGVVPEMPKIDGGTRFCVSRTRSEPDWRLSASLLLQIAQCALSGASLNKFSPAQVVSSGLMRARFADRHV